MFVSRSRSSASRALCRVICLTSCLDCLVFALLLFFAYCGPIRFFLLVALPSIVSCSRVWFSCLICWLTPCCSDMFAFPAFGAFASDLALYCWVQSVWSYAAPSCPSLVVSCLSLRCYVVWAALLFVSCGACCLLLALHCVCPCFVLLLSILTAHPLSVSRRVYWRGAGFSSRCLCCVLFSLSCVSLWFFDLFVFVTFFCFSSLYCLIVLFPCIFFYYSLRCLCISSCISLAPVCSLGSAVSWV